jgi:hypothetical protein
MASRQSNIQLQHTGRVNFRGSEGNCCPSLLPQAPAGPPPLGRLPLFLARPSSRAGPRPSPHSSVRLCPSHPCAPRAPSAPRAPPPGVPILQGGRAVHRAGRPGRHRGRVNRQGQAHQQIPGGCSNADSNRFRRHGPCRQRGEAILASALAAAPGYAPWTAASVEAGPQLIQPLLGGRRRSTPASPPASLLQLVNQPQTRLETDPMYPALAPSPPNRTAPVPHGAIRLASTRPSRRRRQWRSNLRPAPQPASRSRCGRSHLPLAWYHIMNSCIVQVCRAAGLITVYHGMLRQLRGPPLQKGRI